MECSIVIVGEYGIPYEDLIGSIEKKFTVGKVIKLSLEQPVVIEGALRKDIAEGLFYSQKSCDIVALLCAYTYPDVLTALDSSGAEIKVIYCRANLYWRFRNALSWGVTVEDFAQYEQVKVYQDILRARADAIIDLDKVVNPTSTPRLPDLTNLIDRALAKVNIHSSIARNR